jgi:1,5-anhydro-D-fructose reductase (1,5-anhydro-D-mannitol-forming)
LDAILTSDDVDVVYIASPNHLHALHTIEAAKARKHVLVEKPMALQAEDASAMIAAARQYGVKLGVGFHLRHHPAHRHIRDLIAAGFLGDLRVIQVQWGMADAGSTGWWRDREKVGTYITSRRGVHLLDFLRFLTGEDATRVAALSHTSTSGLDETVVTLIRLGPRLFATAVASRELAESANTLAVYGTAGYARSTDTVGTGSGGILESRIGTQQTSIVYQDINPYRLQIEAFDRAIDQDLEPEASGVDGLRSVLLTDAIVGSWETGEMTSPKWELMPDDPG